MTQAPASHRLLIKEPPLQVLPSLAVALGLNEAIFIQQVHYWLIGSAHEIEGRRWCYNTLEGWQKQFPFWGLSTIRRTIDSLRERNVLLIDNFNQNRSLRTLWYSINYDVLDTVDPFVDFNMPYVQFEQMHLSKMNTSSVQNEHMLIEQRLTTETTTETTLKQQHAAATNGSTTNGLTNGDAAKEAAAILDRARSKRGRNG